MEIKKLNIVRGWIWVKQGYQLIMCNPLMSITLALLGALSVFVAFSVPLFGPLVALLLMPVVMAGYMRVCRALEEDEKVELPLLLFEGFKKHTASLVSLGGFTILGLLGASAAMMFVGGDALSTLLENFQTANDPQVLMNSMLAAGSGVASSLMIGLSLVFLLMLALQYAPMLIFFSGLTPLAALRASLIGTVRNFMPYTVYSIIMQVLALALGILPFGIGLIVLLPIGFTSLYVSYRNIFPFPDELVASQSADTPPSA